MDFKVQSVFSDLRYAFYQEVNLVIRGKEVNLVN